MSHVASILATFTAQRHGAPRELIATPAAEPSVPRLPATAAVEGWNVLYLGPDLPAQEIADAASAAAVRVVALSVVYMDDSSRVLGELRALRTRLPATVSIIAGGAGARSIAAELSAIDVLVEASIPGLVAQLRRIWTRQ